MFVIRMHDAAQSEHRDGMHDAAEALDPGTHDAAAPVQLPGPLGTRDAAPPRLSPENKRRFAAPWRAPAWSLP